MLYLVLAGIQGPVILAQGTDRVVVHFKNLASQPYSISPVGITYWKQSEGAELNGGCHHNLSISQRQSARSCCEEKKRESDSAS